jgi:hypothetical protein
MALTRAYLPDAGMRDLVKLATSRPAKPAAALPGAES